MKYFDFKTAAMFFVFGIVLGAIGIPYTEPNYWVISIWAAIIYFSGVKRGIEK